MIIKAIRTEEATEFADEMQPTDDFRTHLGASVVGRECAREVWYSWRWFKLVQYSGRMKRLFQRGHREEPIVIESLKYAGIDVVNIDPNTGKQYRFVGYKGHEGGSSDGFAWNVPDVPVGQWAKFECKTHNAKSFKAVSEMDSNGYNIGLQKNKPEHYGQCQRYMRAWQVFYTLYIAVNKDTDERLYLIIPYVEEHAEQMAQRAQLIVDSEAPPMRLSEKPTFFKCSYCNYKDVCHNGEAPHRSCRSCVYSAPIDGGQWECRNISHPCVINKELMLNSCGNYKAIM